MLKRLFAVIGVKHMASSLKVVTWNLGALQTSPFEFWHPEGSKVRHIQHKLDQSLQSKIDLKISDIFDESKVKSLSGLVESDKLHVITERYRSLAKKSVHAFLTDPEIGRKRFVSMADRVLRDHPVFGLRPSLVTGNTGGATSIEEWWPLYLSFLRNTDPVRKNLFKSSQ